MTENTSEVIPAELFSIHQALLKEGWGVWATHRDLNKEIGQEKFSRISIVTFTHLAAVTAVDVGMGESDFLATCKANYQEAVRRAPRWG